MILDCFTYHIIISLVGARWGFALVWRWYVCLFIHTKSKVKFVSDPIDAGLNICCIFADWNWELFTSTLRRGLEHSKNEKRISSRMNSDKWRKISGFSKQVVCLVLRSLIHIIPSSSVCIDEIWQWSNPAESPAKLLIDSRLKISQDNDDGFVFYLGTRLDRWSGIFAFTKLRSSSIMNSGKR